VTRHPNGAAKALARAAAKPRVSCKNRGRGSGLDRRPPSEGRQQKAEGRITAPTKNIIGDEE
jgi:hypothetical protein